MINANNPFLLVLKEIWAGKGNSPDEVGGYFMLGSHDSEYVYELHKPNGVDDWKVIGHIYMHEVTEHIAVKQLQTA